MDKEKIGNKVGKWSFLIGVILAIILGIIGLMDTTWITVLVIIGIIVGLLNIGDEESEPFLLSGIVLIIASSFGRDAMSIIPVLERILQSLLIIFVPATIIVALKNVFTLAKD